eukprot:TRINITY_DN5574_c0_g1_i1.p1 TRINITY_DN5574_c0_g1~~TRINITY_DN5574_c0_g1_i1.p1  ORF type:complete len:558 (-),score=93.19 TRINITY_DN5574_c0_g1_i1:1370-3043(-)
MKRSRVPRVEGGNSYSFKLREFEKKLQLYSSRSTSYEREEYTRRSGSPDYERNKENLYCDLNKFCASSILREEDSTILKIIDVVHTENHNPNSQRPRSQDFFKYQAKKVSIDLCPTKDCPTGKRRIGKTLSISTETTRVEQVWLGEKPEEAILSFEPDHPTVQVISGLRCDHHTLENDTIAEEPVSSFEESLVSNTIDDMPTPSPANRSKNKSTRSQESSFISKKRSSKTEKAQRSFGAFKSLTGAPNIGLDRLAQETVRVFQKVGRGQFIVKDFTTFRQILEEIGFACAPTTPSLREQEALLHSAWSFLQGKRTRGVKQENLVAFLLAVVGAPAESPPEMEGERLLSEQEFNEINNPIIGNMTDGDAYVLTQRERRQLFKQFALLRENYRSAAHRIGRGTTNGELVTPKGSNGQASIARGPISNCRRQTSDLGIIQLPFLDCDKENHRGNFRLPQNPGTTEKKNKNRPFERSSILTNRLRFDLQKDCRPVITTLHRKNFSSSGGAPTGRATYCEQEQNRFAFEGKMYQTFTGQEKWRYGRRKPGADGDSMKFSSQN